MDQVTSNRGVIEGSMADYMLKIRIASRQNPSAFSRGVGVLGRSTRQNEWIRLGCCFATNSGEIPFSECNLVASTTNSVKGQVGETSAALRSCRMAPVSKVE